MPTLSPAQVAGYARQAGFTPAQTVIMTAIALGESGGRTDVTNTNNDSHGSTDYGVWQINDYWNADVLRSGDWRNPADNARMAKAIYDRQGYRAWSVYKSGLKPEHLAAASSGAKQPVTLPTASIPNPIEGVQILTDPHTWLRVAMFIGGTTITLVALAMIGWTNTPQSIKTAAAKAAKVVVTKKL